MVQGDPHRLLYQRSISSILFATASVAGLARLIWHRILNGYCHLKLSKRPRFGPGLRHITHAYQKKRAVGMTATTGSCHFNPRFRISRPFSFQYRRLLALYWEAFTGMVIYGYWGPTASICREINLTRSPLIRSAVFASAQRSRVRFASRPLCSLRQLVGSHPKF